MKLSKIFTRKKLFSNTCLMLMLFIGLMLYYISENGSILEGKQQRRRRRRRRRRRGGAHHEEDVHLSVNPTATTPHVMSSVVRATSIAMVVTQMSCATLRLRVSGDASSGNSQSARRRPRCHREKKDNHL